MGHAEIIANIGYVQALLDFSNYGIIIVIPEFQVHDSVHHKSILIKVQHDANYAV